MSRARYRNEIYTGWIGWKPFMVALRAFLVFVALVAFFLIGAPLQWLIARFIPRDAHVIPLMFCRSLLRLMKVRVEVAGGRETRGAVLIAANHVSWIDILALGSIMPFCFLAKSDIAAWPMASAFAEVQGTVFVDRKRRRSIPRANREMAARLLQGRTGLLFPEATTIDGPLGPFYSSHFAAVHEVLRLAPDALVLVQPVALSYSSPAAAWVGDDALLPHLWRTLRDPPLTCHIGFGTPIGCTAKMHRKTIARTAREAIVALNEARLRDAAQTTVGARDFVRPAATSC